MPSPNQNPLVFIQESVLHRLETGTFVPARRSKPASFSLTDRRDSVSPLAVSKRCIRYEPRVFLNRTQRLLTIARGLNNPEKKIILISGPQGNGKTTLARGIIELMGGGQEQLLWFDVTIHTDVEEVMNFFVQYITYIANALSIHPPSFPDHADPFQQLETWLENVNHIPLLIVIDNMEHIVNDNHRLHSKPLKELLNFLLSFPNIKMMLLGEILPDQDLQGNAAALVEIPIQGLNEADITTWLQGSHGRQILAELPPPILTELFQMTQGVPWLVRLLLFVEHRGDVDWQALINQVQTHRQTRETPYVEAIIRFLYEQLPPEEQRIAEVLSLFRHAADPITLKSVTRLCNPHLSQEPFDHLQQSLLRPTLKKTFPPQLVLGGIHHRLSQTHAFDPWYEMYRDVKKAIYHHIPQEDRRRMHRLFQEFYRSELQKSSENRIYRVQVKAVETELKHHANAAHRRDQTTSGLLEGKTYISRSQFATPTLPTHEEATSSGTPDPTVSLPYNAKDMKSFPLQETAPKNSKQRDPLLEGSKEISFSLSAEEQQLLLEEGQPPLLPEPHASPQGFEEDLSAPADLTTVRSFGEDAPPIGNTLQQQLASAVAAQDKTAIAEALVRLGRDHYSQRLYEPAERALLKAQRLLAPEAREALGECHQLLGAIHKETFRHNSALAHLQQAAQAMAHTPEATMTLGQIETDMGDIAAYRKHYDEALRHFQQALGHYAQGPKGVKTAEVYFKMAQVYDAQGEGSQAIGCYEASLDLDRAAENHLSVAATLSNLGLLHMEQSNLSEALQCFQSSLQYDQQAENPEGQYNTLSLLGALHRQQGNTVQAEAQYRKMAALARQESQPTWEATAYMKLGDLYHQVLKQPKEALAFYHQAKGCAWEELSTSSQAMLTRRIQETTP